VHLFQLSNDQLSNVTLVCDCHLSPNIFFYFAFLSLCQARKLQMNHAEVSGLLSVGMHETDVGGESYAVEYPKMDQDTSHETTKFDVVMATSALYTDNINTNACLDEYQMPGIQPMEEIKFGNAQPFELLSKGTAADSEEESMPSSPDTSSTGYMEQNLQHMYDALVYLLVLNYNL